MIIKCKKKVSIKQDILGVLIFLVLQFGKRGDWNICILYCVMRPAQNDCSSCKRQGGMFSVLMGTLRKVPILPDISYSQINVVQVGVSIMKIRGEQVNYISVTEQPGVLIKMIRKIAVLLSSVQLLIKLYKNDMAFWGASQSVPQYLEPEIVDPSQSKMCATLKEHFSFIG